ncbi:MAG: SpoIIE family protein phosphatase, partial [Bacteroidales bacterium]|nr:SpoIIE family protein phosphatase [Bacteroidales bacterium]
MGGIGQIMKVDMNTRNSNEIYGRANGIPADRITTMYHADKNTLWFGTDENGLYKMDLNSKRASKYYTSENSLENNINAITGDNGMLWIATNNGVISIDVVTGSIVRYSTDDGLAHNKINDIFTDSESNVWIATRSNGLHSVNTNIDFTISGNAVLEFVSVTEDNEGNLWAATDNNGVFKFSDTLSYYSMNDGLKSNACYSIVNDGKGNIWVGHRLGLSKINVAENWIATYGPESGINGDCHPNAVNVTRDGEVLFGTSDGLVTFDTGKERNNVTAPFVNITSVRIADREYDISEPIVLPYGIYKMRIDFIGLNFMAPERVTYQYRLDGYDDWSEPTTLPYIQYGRVEDGEYTFQLIACNSEGVCNEVPVGFSLRIKLPIWKTWWFITIVVFVLIFTVFLIIKFRERKAKLFQEMLQKKLDERTREVVMQKEEIEVKNKDITDSINYAQRIQASILPPISKLHDTFAGSFVFYQPRDIVSGDFYWYDRFDDKFIIVCADSTGHGVPGAFMSMIGTTLIKDICGRAIVETPDILLYTLDKEIMAALNQNIEAERSNDGMDIIVAEVDLKTNKLNIASAMRPVIIYQGGEQIYVRGSRSSVGGQYEVDDKMFEPQEFQLQPGDKFYMFSDGYPDQFGGPLGKKFKMVRLKNMLRDLHEKTMDEQYNYIKNNFELWRADLEQIDDVLFMGIEL